LDHLKGPKHEIIFGSEFLRPLKPIWVGNLRIVVTLAFDVFWLKLIRGQAEHALMLFAHVQHALDPFKSMLSRLLMFFNACA
jgi:hypothetical protein